METLAKGGTHEWQKLSSYSTITWNTLPNNVIHAHSLRHGGLNQKVRGARHISNTMLRRKTIFDTRKTQNSDVVIAPYPPPCSNSTVPVPSIDAFRQELDWWQGQKKDTKFECKTLHFLVDKNASKNRFLTLNG